MTHASGPVGAVTRRRDTTTDPLSLLEAARERIEREREELAAERDAFDRFAGRVADLDPEPEPSAAGTPPAMTLLRTDADGTASRVVAAYRETVMALPHYDDAYGDTPAESLRAELGPEIATALTGRGEFSSPLRRAVLEAARTAASRRSDFDRTLATEAASLDDARTTLSEVDSVLRTVADREAAGSGTEATLDRQVERCEAVSRARQRLRRRRLLPDHLDATDLCTYLYSEFEWTYPVLSAVTALCERIERLRRRQAA
jgi:hypothetical protein